ncbi:MAG: hypothetical protein ACI4TK_18145 [Agathobacter sp.]
MYKKQKIFFPEFVYSALLTFGAGCGIIMVSRGDGNHFRVAVVQVNEIKKKCKKPLDKLPNLCYNKGTKGEGRSQKASPTRDE